MVERLVNSEANARRIAMVESCFGTSGQPLSVPGRVLVGEGVLTKMCRKKPKPRQFFLFNDILVYGNIVINKKKYNKQHIIPLEEVMLENIQDQGSERNGWLIRTARKSFAVYAATATEKSEWMAHINKCVEDLLRKSGKKQPKNMQLCGCLIQTLRCHHCRKCGAVVCNPCSNKKCLLPNQSSKPLRVCLSCYDQLWKAKADYSMPSQAENIGNNETKSYESSGEDDSDDDDDVKMDVTDQAERISQEPKFYNDDDVKINTTEMQESDATSDGNQIVKDDVENV
uniref:FYVE-type domain-containing protein n=1 Tax=Strigamia maritima TaxID=126957 RepID=T1JJ79_STRMM